jgi:hypothetical protein
LRRKEAGVRSFDTALRHAGRGHEGSTQCGAGQEQAQYFRVLLVASCHFGGQWHARWHGRIFFKSRLEKQIHFAIRIEARAGDG